MNELEQARETLNRLEARAQREDKGQFASKEPQTVIVSNPETKYELGQSAYSSGNTITFIKSIKGNDIALLKEEYKVLAEFCVKANKEASK